MRLHPISPNTTRPAFLRPGTRSSAPASHRRSRLPADHELADQVREGAVHRYRELIDRHGMAVGAYLDTCFADPAARDRTCERVFEDVLCTIRAGAEPRTCWRSRLLVTARVLAVRWWVAAPEDPALKPEFRAWADQGAAWPLSLRPHLSEAYRRLPHPWQALLWHHAVELDSPYRICKVTGVPHYELERHLRRARTELRATYLHAHHAPHRTNPDCEVYGHLLAAALAEPPASGAYQALVPHLQVCTSCALAYDDLASLEHRLREQLPAMLLGWWQEDLYRHARDTAAAPHPQPPAFLDEQARLATRRRLLHPKQKAARLALRIGAGIGATSLIASIGAAVVNSARSDHAMGPSGDAVPPAAAPDTGPTDGTPSAPVTAAPHPRPPVHTPASPTPAATPSAAVSSTATTAPEDSLAGYLLSPAADLHEADAFDDRSDGAAAAVNGSVPMTPGTWLRYDNIDFGTASPGRILYTLGDTGNSPSSTQLDLHIDSLTSAPVASLRVTGGTYAQVTYAASLTTRLTGVHTIYIQSTCAQTTTCTTLRSFTMA